MNSKQLQVLLALQDLIQAALPDAQVLGLQNEGAPPERIPLDGRVVIRAGDPGEPEVDLSPLTYNYDHQIPLELAAHANADLGVSSAEAIDAMVQAIGGAIAANRTLGGLVDFLDGYSPSLDDIYVPGGAIARSADPVLVASYSTTTPL